MGASGLQAQQWVLLLYGPTFWNMSDRRAFSWMTWRTMRGGSRNSRYATNTEASTKNCKATPGQTVRNALNGPKCTNGPDILPQVNCAALTALKEPPPSRS